MCDIDDESNSNENNRKILDLNESLMIRKESLDYIDNVESELEKAQTDAHAEKCIIINDKKSNIVEKREIDFDNTILSLRSTNSKIDEELHKSSENSSNDSNEQPYYRNTSSDITKKEENTLLIRSFIVNEEKIEQANKRESELDFMIHNLKPNHQATVETNKPLIDNSNEDEISDKKKKIHDCGFHYFITFMQRLLGKPKK